MSIVAILAPNTAAAATPAHAAATADGRAATDTSGHFDHQFEIARQQHTNSADPGSASKTAGHRPGDPRQQPDRPPRTTDATDAVAVPAATAVPKAAAATDAAALANAAVTPKAAVAAKAAAAPKAAENSEHAGDHGGDHAGDPAATAMAGAMLALLGPSLAVALRPGAAVTATVASGIAAAGNGGKGLAADANAGAAALGLRQAADAGSGAAATPALPPNAGAAPAAHALASPKAEPASDPAGALGPMVALPAPPAGGAPAGVPLLHLSAPAGSPAFAQELGEHVAWLGGQDVAQARIRLHPAELGQLDVKINVAHGQVDVVFSAQHPAAVNAVQQSLPRLEQLLAQHGLALGHAMVGQHDHGGHRGQHGDEQTAASLGDIDEVQGIGLSVPTAGVGLLDAFA
ncbi:MAG: flagellar hook-length control protein FliK [Pseudomonadota bacterium]|nr:flagellar hook-length control protein FliK [Pseudomonadota bacterium]